MAKLYLAPVVGIVTIRALALVMVLWQCMARLTIGITSMIENHFFPIGGIVAIGALPGVMILGIVLQVTGLAIVKAGMFKGNVFPVSSIGVAINAGTKI
jgi:hypothetical protein